MRESINREIEIDRERGLERGRGIRKSHKKTHRVKIGLVTLNKEMTGGAPPLP